MYIRIAFAAVAFCTIPVLALLAQLTAMYLAENGYLDTIMTQSVWLWIVLGVISVSGLAVLTREMVIEQKREDTRSSLADAVIEDSLPEADQNTYPSQQSAQSRAA